jgi:fatty-acid peroxygenase
MDLRRFPLVDSSLSLLLTGYSWLPSRWRRSEKPVVHARLLGQHAVALRGPEAVPFFYDERNIRREGAVPGLVQDTLFGRDAVHTLDGEPHRVRKGMFVSLLMEPRRVAALAESAGATWDKTATSWTSKPSVVLFDETSRIITEAVCRWADVPLEQDEVPRRATDLVATIDGFATLTLRHWRARLARFRLEKWVARLVTATRNGAVTVPAGSVLGVVAAHRDSDGELLEPRVAAVEVLNIVRPTVAISWYVTFAAHALHRWPEHRTRLRDGDPAFAEAFAHELRRFYPFAPFVGGKAAGDRTWQGEPVPDGAMVLLDLYGQNHDSGVFPDPYVFDPRRFLERPVHPNELVPQGGGDPATGHRCPGEDITVETLKTFVQRLAQLDYDVPSQDLEIPFTRIPTRPRSGFVMRNVRAPH